ncbi:unnamed protein product [Brassica rapa subsp. trilocularis]
MPCSTPRNEKPNWIFFSESVQLVLNLPKVSQLILIRSPKMKQSFMMFVVVGDLVIVTSL